MFKDFEEQLNLIIANTEAKTNVTMAQIGAYKMMMQCIAVYVSKEAAENESFNEALSLGHKSVARMMKFLYDHAKDLAVDNIACVPDDMVYDWVNQYYFADDKAEIDEMLRKEAEAKAQAEERKKKEKELNEKSREKAIEKLESSEGWNELPEDEKKKKINEEARQIRSRLEAAERRKNAPKKGKKASAKVEFDPEVAADIAEAIGSTPEDVMSGKAFEKKAEEVKDKISEVNDTPVTEEANEEAVAQKPASYVPTLKEVEGQLSIFDLMIM